MFVLFAQGGQSSFEERNRRCSATEALDSLSAHADQMEMIEFLSNLNRKKLKTLFLVHGEKDQQEIFKSVLENHDFSNIKFPKLKEEFTLNVNHNCFS